MRNLIASTGSAGPKSECSFSNASIRVKSAAGSSAYGVPFTARKIFARRRKAVHRPSSPRIGTMVIHGLRVDAVEVRAHPGEPAPP